MSMGLSVLEPLDNLDTTRARQKALRYILEAWDEALHDGLETDLVASAALFAALADLVTTYGEDAVARMTDSLSERISHGEFTLERTLQ